MFVMDIIKKKGSLVHTITQESTLQDAARTLADKKIGVLVVVDGAQAVAGIISERDIVYRLARDFSAAATMKVGEIMTRKVIIAVPEDDIDYVCNIMTANHVRHLPVVSTHKLEGIISIRDVLSETIRQCKVEKKYLHDYITGKYF